MCAVELFKAELFNERMPLCLSRHNHMLSDVPRDGQMWPVNASALTGRPSTRSPVRPGANTLPQKWSLGQSKCQLCAMKPMSQCWRGTQGRREASNQTTPSIWITSSAGLQQFFQVLFKCLSLLCESSATNSRSSGLLTVNQAEGFQLAFASWTQRQTALDCWHRDCASVFGSPGVTGQIAEALLLCWTTCRKNKGHASSQSGPWTRKVSPVYDFLMPHLQAHSSCGLPADYRLEVRKESQLCSVKNIQEGE